MQVPDIPEAVLLFAEHLSRAADPFYALRGLPFTYYLQYWQTVVSKSVARGLATVAVLADHKSIALGNELAWTDTGGRQEGTAIPSVVCAVSTLPASEFLKIDEEDSKHGDREVEDAVYDSHFEAFFRKPLCPLQKLVYIIGGVTNPQFHCPGVARRTTDLVLRFAVDQGFLHAVADCLSNAGSNFATKTLGVKLSNTVSMPLSKVKLKDGRQPFDGRTDIPNYAMLAWVDLSEHLPRSRL
ncbi:hypothetical protein KFL_003940100 [Klebsormidium nitens]|uniref:Uncharacterized protein n=1 Tax=Klebsormidium nitens TaxID=105231 RepID=A0A1Y1IEZ3_KLENI|nr:hypothetical protein KFL_003940100 [Klebsormidium nitens]|eukprot:GAQ88019.1 hypothetical protein KFL_003940100 [Klebsormidium nitens]